MTSYDAIIIGTGQAGPALARRLTSAGRKVAVIERKRFGGTCVNTGCIPTKTLVASARAAHAVRGAGQFGVRVEGDVSVDMRAVKARKDAIVRRSNEGVEKSMRTLENGTVYVGHASFEAPRAVRVGDERLEADQIFINVGARPREPDRGYEGVAYLTSSGMMHVDYLPEHLIIVGGGYVGLEYAQMFRRFGSRVTVVETGARLLRRDDEDVADAVRAILEGEDVELRLDATCVGAEPTSSGVRVRVDCHDGSPTVDGSHLLLAIGRRPNTDDLGLDRAGIETDDRGYIRVDDELRTSVPGIWALGDCNGRGAFTHTSYNDFEIVAANLLDGDRRRVSDRILIYGLYIDPPLGRVGSTEADVRASGRRALKATREMSRVGRAVEQGDTRGFMKVLVDADSRRILGAAVLGIGGDEVVHSIADVMYADAPYTVIQRAVHAHPTVSELIPTMLGDLSPLQ